MDIQKSLDNLAISYETAVDKLAQEMREKHVIPFCNKHMLEFSAGNGSWSFHTKNREERTFGKIKIFTNQIDAEDLETMAGTKKLLAALEAETLFNNDLGSMMQCYKPW